MLKIGALIREAVGLLWGFLRGKWHDQCCALETLIWHPLIEGLQSGGRMIN